ncbi:hypothetical protein SFRURICE_003849 [Spodoptera frugiperda]|nr:hypothetical protein SFRURICE_003849 [Spodoptera frugiperda]
MVELGGAGVRVMFVNGRCQLGLQSQSLTLRTIVKAPRFVRNATISRDLGVESVDDFVQRLSTNMFERAGKSRHDHLRALAPYHRRPPDGYGLPRDLVAPTDPPDAAT